MKNKDNFNMQKLRWMLKREGRSSKVRKGRSSFKNENKFASRVPQNIANGTKIVMNVGQALENPMGTLNESIKENGNIKFAHHSDGLKKGQHHVKDGRKSLKSYLIAAHNKYGTHFVVNLLKKFVKKAKKNNRTKRDAIYPVSPLLFNNNLNLRQPTETPKKDEEENGDLDLNQKSR